MSLTIYKNKNKKEKDIVIPDGKYKVNGVFTINNKGITNISDSNWTKIERSARR